MTFVQRTACKTHAKKRHNIEIRYLVQQFSAQLPNVDSQLRIYPRNPECPQSEASLAQLSMAQRLEQQQIQERLQQQQQHQQQLQQQQQQLQHRVPVIASGPAHTDPGTVTLSTTPSIQVGSRVDP